MKPSRIETSDLTGLPPPAHERREGQQLDGEELGGPNLSAISARMGANSVISTIEKSAPTNEEVKRRSAPGRLPLPRHRIAVERRRTDHGSPGC